MNSKYFIRDINKKDFCRVVEIYNSNSKFLLNHLGKEFVDEDFISKEVLEMGNAGFNSCVIVNRDSQEVQGVLDYKAEQEVYLSLLMLDADIQGKGIGSEIYSCFETEMNLNGKSTIRIDVVNDYPENVIPFWKKLGFLEDGSIALRWVDKESKAVVMRKRI